MKLLRILLVLVVSMLLGFYLMAVALAIHPFFGGIVLGVTTCLFLYMIHNNTKQ